MNHLSTSTVIRSLALAMALTIVGFLASDAPAKANGVPTEVELSYINLSNFGPQDASGTVELIFAEGLVRLDAQGMRYLGSGQTYNGWLVNSETGDAISIGRFPASSVGVISYQGSLPPIADFGFDLIILTVEPEPDNSSAASTLRSIGGYFSLIGEAAVDGRGDDAAVGGAEPEIAPGQLPNTGDATLVADTVRVSLLLGLALVSIAFAMQMSRRSS